MLWSMWLLLFKMVIMVLMVVLCVGGILLVFLYKRVMQLFLIYGSVGV